MKRFYGIMCYAAFILTAATYLVGLGPDVQAEVREVNPTHTTIVEQGWTGAEEEATVRKASSLEVVWMYNCEPCRRLKEVVKELKKEGYAIRLVNRLQDTRGSTRFPSLYYLGSIGGLVKTEIGYQTATHIKQYLGK